MSSIIESPFPGEHNSVRHDAVLRNLYVEKLSEIIHSWSGTKATVWDEKLMEPLSLIGGATIFKEKNANEFLKLKKGSPYSCNSVNIIFFIRSIPSIVENVKDFIDNFQGDISTKKLGLYFLPNQSTACIELIKKLELDKKLHKIDVFPLYIYPLDRNLFSMEQHQCFFEFFVEKDISLIMNVVNSIEMLESVFGKIVSIQGIGHYSKRIFEILKNRSMENNEELFCSSKIDNLVLIDRNIDCITPMICPNTFSGLVDEIIGISCGTVNVMVPETSNQTTDSANKNIEEKSNKGMKKVLLFPSNINSELTDVYREVKNKGFYDVGLFLHGMTKSIALEVETLKGQNSVQEMKRFVSQLPNINKVKSQIYMQTTIAEIIKKQIESDTYKEFLETEQDIIKSLTTNSVHSLIEKKIALLEPFEQVIKLICLQSVIGGGFKTSVYEAYCKLLTQAYGYTKLTTIIKLGQADLLSTKSFTKSSISSGSVYYSLWQSLNSVFNKNFQGDDNNISDFHSNYMPITTGLVRFILQHSALNATQLKPIKDSIKKIPEGMFSQKFTAVDSESSSTVENKTILVFFLGGVTYSEISHLELMMAQNFPNHQLLVGCTSVINSFTFFKNIDPSDTN